MIKVLVDSAADYTLDELKENNLLMVPLQINIENESYLDSVTIFKDDFYDKLINQSLDIKTSQPTPQSFVDVFEQIKNDQDSLIYIALSSGLSGTYQSACLAKELVEYDQIYLIDSLNATGGIQILVDVALKRIKQGSTVEKIVDEIENLKHRITLYASMETLHYLQKGGRISKTSAVIGDIAKIKPIITVTKDGKADVCSKKVGIHQSAKYMVEQLQNTGIDTNYPLVSLTSYGEKNVEYLESKLNEININVAKRVQIGPTIGTHIGPAAFGLVFIHQ